MEGKLRAMDLSDNHKKFVEEQIDKFRDKLLSINLGNNLLSYEHTSKNLTQMRIIDELYENIFDQLEGGKEFSFSPLPLPLENPDDEDGEEFVSRLKQFKEKNEIYLYARKGCQSLPNSKRKNELEKIERQAKDFVRQELGMDKWVPQVGLKIDELCRRHEINPDYELIESGIEESGERYHDSYLQTKENEQQLLVRLKRLYDRSRLSINQKGVGTLFCAFGFLKWFEDDASNKPLYAPLILFPVEIKRYRGIGRNNFRLSKMGGGKPTSNITLEHRLKGFEVDLPKFDKDDSPESYLNKVKNEVCAFNSRWEIKRFLTIGIFDYLKIAIYQDLDVESWKAGEDLSCNKYIQKLFTEKRPINPSEVNKDLDVRESFNKVPVLISNADSSQHSAITEILKGNHLTVIGPPGTGKSQTIANTIAAATFEGKKVLFVAEKLAALEVVRDRLDSVGLGPFCFNLHTKGLVSKEVKSALERRLRLNDSDFSQANYENQKREWSEKFKVLDDYSKIMKSKIGESKFTVHDIIWYYLKTNEKVSDLADVRDIRLDGGEELTPQDYKQQKNWIEEMVQNRSILLSNFGESDSYLWKGVNRIDITDFETVSIFQILGNWAQSLIKISELLDHESIQIKLMSIKEISKLDKGIRLALKNSKLLSKINYLKTLASKQSRNKVTNEISIILEIQKLENNLKKIFEGNIFPDTNQLKSVKKEIESLSVTELSSNQMKCKANGLSKKVKELNSLENLVRNIARKLKINEINPKAYDTIETVVRILNDTDLELINLRNPNLFKKEARSIIESALTSQKLHDEKKQKLSKILNIDRIITINNLDTHINNLQNLRGITGINILLNRGASEALKFHQLVSLKNAKAKPNEAISDFLLAKEFLELTDQIEKDELLKNYLRKMWNGLTTDFSKPLRVIKWSENIFHMLPGEEDGNATARKTLLEEESDLLLAIKKMANDLPENWKKQIIKGEAPKMAAEANRLDTLSEEIKNIGLNSSMVISKQHNLVNNLSNFHKLSEETKTFEIINKVLPNYRKKIKDLTKVKRLAEEMNNLNLTTETWNKVISLIEYNSLTSDFRKKLNQSIDEESKNWENLVEKLEINEKVFLEGKIHKKTPLDTLISKAEKCKNGREVLKSWSAYTSPLQKISQTNSSDIISQVEQRNIPFDRLVDIFDLSYYTSLLAKAYQDFPFLKKINRGQLLKHREEFKKYENKLLELESKRIFHTLGCKIIEEGNFEGRPSDFTELALIRHQLSLKRMSINLRNLLARSGTALRQLMPCFMMSPATVSELLPKEKDLFDLVIIDEASQMIPSDAMGSINRAKQSVIVGDPKQLPPTSFFQGSIDSDGGEDDYSSDSESILDLTYSDRAKTRNLHWHYRSRHSGLIQFSNSRFYHNDLIVFPGPDENRDDRGIKFNYIIEGYYKSGQNIKEADQVIEAAINFMSNPDNKEFSLAIVTMNQKQRDYIDDKLYEKSEQIPAVKRYLTKWQGTLHPFIVRNLETIQGDERDVVFISTVYGREAEGQRVKRTFGPITKIGGERRLNVLFTRACYRMEVFTSMRANEIQITPGISEGVKVLRDFLEYAATGNLVETPSSDNEPESPFEEHVFAKLKERGFEADPQVGVKGYRIDFGIKHPNYQHGYLLGLECDGRQYHSSPSARDRDRLREEVLRGMGWDIYRIWSTDWFEDPNGELDKLEDYINVRLQEIQNTSQESDNLVPLVGDIVVQDNNTNIPIEIEPENEPLFIEVGDTVDYFNLAKPEQILRVTLVEGASNSLEREINDQAPLFQALIGAEKEESIPVKTSNHEFLIKVVRIVKNVSALDSNTSNRLDQYNDFELAPYNEWRNTSPHPLNQSIKEVASSLLEIIEIEGPVTTARAFKVFVHQSPLSRLTRLVRKSLNKATYKLELEQKIKVLRYEDQDNTYANAILYTPNSDLKLIRELGSRSFEEVPLCELAEFFQRIKSKQPQGVEDEEIFRKILDAYGLVRMTTQTINQFKKSKLYAHQF